MLFLDESEVADNLDMQTLIDTMRQAMMDFSAGDVVQPMRQMIEANDGFLGVMPAFGGGLGAKLVTLYPGNAALGLETHNAIIVIFDPTTGVPTAVMDGRLITEMRTAAVSAVAADLLAAPDARVLGVLGSGVQSKSHIDAFRRIRDIDEIRIWSPTSANATTLANKVGANAVSSARDAVDGADIIVAATASTSPVLDGTWVGEGTHVCSVGAPRPDWRELDDMTMTNVVVVDSRSAAAVESGDVIGSGASIYAELGELLVSGAADLAGRTTVFKSLGLAIQDVRSAQLVLDTLDAR